MEFPPIDIPAQSMGREPWENEIDVMGRLCRDEVDANTRRIYYMVNVPVPRAARSRLCV